MADVAAIRGQIATGRAQIASARSATQAQRLPTLTTRELRKQTPLSGVRRKSSVRKFDVAKSSRLSDIKKQEAIFEKSAVVTEGQLQAYEAAQREAADWARAKSLVDRKGAAAIWIAKGSGISAKVKRLVDARDLGSSGDISGFAAFSGARPTGVEQTTVAEAQARANVVEATKELAMIKGTSFTPAQELEAQKQFSQVIARAGTGDLTARETQILTDTGIFEKQIQPQVVPKVSFAGSQLRKDMGFGGQASDVFKTSTRAPVITRTKLTREGLPPGVTGIYPEQTNIEKIKSQLSKLRLYGREKSREGWEGLAGVTPLIAETGKRTAQMIIPRDITSTPERGTKFTFKSETAAEPAGLPKEERMSIKVPIITTETAGRIGAGAAVIGAYSVPFLGELAMSSSVAHGIETVKAPISEIKFLKTGVRPEGIKNDDWDKYKREIDEYNKAQIERQKALRSQKKMALVEIGLSGTILGTRIYRGGKWFLKEPIDKVVMRGKNYAINKYEASTKVYPGGATAKGTIRTYVPPDRAIYTTRARKLFGLKDKIDTIGKGKKFITEYDLISGKVGVAGKYETTKVGSRQTIKGVFGGAAERITPESFAQLPKSQQYIYRKLVEGKLGKPVSLKNVPKMLGKADLSKGSMFQIDRYKVGPQYKYVPKKGVVLDIGSKRYQIYNPKKSIRLYEGVAESEKGVTIGIGKKGGKELIRYKLDEGKVSLDVVGFKKVSPTAKPIARGGITKLEGTTTYEYYDYPSKVFEPTNLGKVKPVPDIYNLAQIGKPTIQTTVPKLTAIQKQSIQGALVTKPVPKIAPSKIPKMFATGETGVGLTAQELAPRMVGGLGLGLSQYSKTDLDTASITMPSLKTLPITISESRVGYTQKPISPQVTKPVVISTTVQKPVIITSQIIKPLTAQASRQAQVVKPVVAQKSLTTITPPVPVIRPPTPPPTIIGGYYRRPQQPKVSRPIVKPSKPKPTSYAVDVRKKGGVWAQVIKGVTKKEASAIGMLETKKGAIASFRKRVVGGRARKQKIYAPTYLKALFRPSKYEKGVIVEKEGLRITTRKEVKEISYMGGLAVKGKKRKKKGGKKKK